MPDCAPCLSRGQIVRAEEMVYDDDAQRTMYKCESCKFQNRHILKSFPTPAQERGPMGRALGHGELRERLAATAPTDGPIGIAPVPRSTYCPPEKRLDDLPVSHATTDTEEDDEIIIEEDEFVEVREKELAAMPKPAPNWMNLTKTAEAPENHGNAGRRGIAPEAREKAQALLDKGIPVTEIVKQVGISRETVFKMKREMKALRAVSYQKPAETVSVRISNSTAIEKPVKINSTKSGYAVVILNLETRRLELQRELEKLDRAIELLTELQK